MERSLYQTEIIAMPKGGGDKRAAAVELAASGRDGCVVLLNGWLDEQGLEACLLGSIRRMRKARRQERNGIISAHWREL